MREAMAEEAPPPPGCHVMAFFTAALVVRHLTRCIACASGRGNAPELLPLKGSAARPVAFLALRSRQPNPTYSDIARATRRQGAKGGKTETTPSEELHLDKSFEVSDSEAGGAGGGERGRCLRLGGQQFTEYTLHKISTKSKPLHP